MNKYKISKTVSSSAGRGAVAETERNGGGGGGSSSWWRSRWWRGGKGEEKGDGSPMCARWRRGLGMEERRCAHRQRLRARRRRSRRWQERRHLGQSCRRGSMELADGAEASSAQASAGGTATAPRGQGAAALDVTELGRRGGVEERISGALGPVSAEKKRNGGAGLEARPVDREGKWGPGCRQWPGRGGSGSHGGGVNRGRPLGHGRGGADEWARGHCVGFKPGQPSQTPFKRN
jgi:hypothetical protein